MTPIALAAAAAFNLVCTGTTTIGKLGQWEPDSKTQFTTVYRVDLARKRWCDGACVETAALVEVTPDRIVFEREERGDYNDTVTFVDRESGRYEHRFRSGWIGTVVSVMVSLGTCQQARFTGLPVRKF